MAANSFFNGDKVALLMGSSIFLMALLMAFNSSLFGWVVKIEMRVDNPIKAWQPTSKGLMPSYAAALANYAFITLALAAGVKLMGGNVVRFVKSFMVSNFRKLMEEGIGRLAVVYMVCLFGFIIWLGLCVSYVLFHGMTPPLMS